jgi:hypothetical protein
MPWPELQGLLLAHLRHRYTSYEADLRAGADRDQLHREIHAAAFHAFPFLRSDPRPFEPDPPRRKPFLTKLLGCDGTFGEATAGHV